MLHLQIRHEAELSSSRLVQRIRRPNRRAKSALNRNGEQRNVHGPGNDNRRVGSCQQGAAWAECHLAVRSEEIPCYRGENHSPS